MATARGLSPLRDPPPDQPDALGVALPAPCLRPGAGLLHREEAATSTAWRLSETAGGSFRAGLIYAQVLLMAAMGKIPGEVRLWTRARAMLAGAATPASLVCRRQSGRQAAHGGVKDQ